MPSWKGKFSPLENVNVNKEEEEEEFSTSYVNVPGKLSFIAYTRLVLALYYPALLQVLALVAYL